MVDEESGDEHEPAWTHFQDAVLNFTRARGLSLLSEGMDNKQISAQLSISEKTVRNHVSSVYERLGVGTRAQAVVFAREDGFRA